MTRTKIMLNNSIDHIHQELVHHLHSLKFKDISFPVDPLNVEAPGEDNPMEYVNLSIPTFHRSKTRVRLERMADWSVRLTLVDKRYIPGKDLTIYVYDSKLEDAKRILSALADPDLIICLVGIEDALPILEKYLEPARRTQ